MFEQSQLDAPALATVRAALDAIFRQREPFPVVVMDGTPPLAAVGWQRQGAHRPGSVRTARPLDVRVMYSEGMTIRGSSTSWPNRAHWHPAWTKHVDR